jgi:hypothetical protein
MHAGFTTSTSKATQATRMAASGGGIEYGEEDLSSEKALWALYERSSTEYKVKRQPNEKA